MSRKKLKKEDKRQELSISLDIFLNDKLEKYMSENGYDNKSKYIERLIKEDLTNRGENIEEKF